MALRRAAVCSVVLIALAIGLASCGTEPAPSPVATPTDVRVAPLIEKLLDRDHPRAQQEAYRELSALGPVVVAPLLDVLEREDGDVFGAASAAEVLASLGTEAAPAVAALTRWLVVGGGCSSACSRALAGLGEVGVPGLVRGLGSPDKWARFRSADALRELGSVAAAAADPLIAALGDEDDEVRLMAARALGALGAAARKAVPRLLEAMKDEDEDLRYAAVTALGEVSEGDDEVIEVLARAMCNDLDWSVRRAAIGALDAMVLDRKRALGLMRQALEFGGMRSTAIHGLLRRGVDEEELVRETLEAAVGRGPKAWLAAAAFLRQSGPNGRAAARELLVKTLEWSPDAAQRIQAARSLATLGQEAVASIAVLQRHAEPAAEEPEVAEAARAALEAIRTR